MDTHYSTALRASGLFEGELSFLSSVIKFHCTDGRTYPVIAFGPQPVRQLMKNPQSLYGYALLQHRKKAGVEMRSFQERPFIELPLNHLSIVGELARCEKGITTFRISNRFNNYVRVRGELPDLTLLTTWRVLAKINDDLAHPSSDPKRTTRTKNSLYRTIAS